MAGTTAMQNGGGGSNSPQYSSGTENQSPNGNAPISLEASAAASAGGHLSNGSARGGDASPNTDHHHQHHLPAPPPSSSQQQQQQNKRDHPTNSTNSAAVSVITNISLATFQSFGIQQLDAGTQDSLEQQVTFQGRLEIFLLCVVWSKFL
jgi:hypothetical protein